MKIIVLSAFLLLETCGLADTEKGVGEPCTRDDECQTPLGCLGGVCAAPADAAMMDAAMMDAAMMDAAMDAAMMDGSRDAE